MVLKKHTRRPDACSIPSLPRAIKGKCTVTVKQPSDNLHGAAYHTTRDPKIGRAGKQIRRWHLI